MYKITQTFYQNRRLWKLTILDRYHDFVGIYSFYLHPDSDVINVPLQRHLSVHAAHRDMWLPIIKYFDGKTTTQIKEYLELLVLINQDWVFKTEELE
mgnify:FL=1